jgi:hypothetical protein
MRYATSLAKASLALVLPFILAHLRKPGVRATPLTYAVPTLNGI